MAGTGGPKIATMQQGAPTLHDVAKAAGVSTATVSRCINSPDQVIEKTRARVEEAIRKLGYSPNFGARVMAAKRTNTIGAIIPTMENAIFARGLQAFQEELRQAGYTLLVASSSYRTDVEEEQVRSLIARGADGLLLIGHDRADAIRQFLKTRGVPVLVAWAFDEAASLPSIGFDNCASMRALAERVIELGHRHIAVISAETRGNDRARRRVEGVREAIAAAHLPAEQLHVVETTYGVDQGAEAFGRLMARKDPPSAVICGNDVLAVGAIKRAHDLGLDVPGDVSITGFDDIELARIVSPPLTTVHVPHRTMGRKAARMLVEMVETGHAARSERLATELCERESLGPPGRHK